MSQTDDLSDQFFQDIVDVSGRLQLEPLDLLGVMMAESGVKAASNNPSSNASGLIQFLPSTLQHLGWTGTPQQFRQLSAEEQLPYVEQYFQPYVHFGLNSAARVYQVVFLPSSLQLGSSPNTVIVEQGGINSAAYNGNRNLDTNSDGRITVGELQQAIERHLNSARWQEIAARLEEAGGGGGGPTGGNGGGGGSIDLRTQQGISAALEALGFDQGSLAEAVRAFQQQSGLHVDGVVGKDTRGALATALQDSGIAFTV